jgi:hypothetical protein
MAPASAVHMSAAVVYRSKLTLRRYRCQHHRLYSKNLCIVQVQHTNKIQFKCKVPSKRDGRLETLAQATLLHVNAKKISVTGMSNKDTEVILNTKEFVKECNGNLAEEAFMTLLSCRFMPP